MFTAVLNWYEKYVRLHILDLKRVAHSLLCLTVAREKGHLFAKHNKGLAGVFSIGEVSHLMQDRRSEARTQSR